MNIDISVETKERVQAALVRLRETAHSFPLSQKEKATAVLRIEIEREEDGRWIAEVPMLPGVVAYGANETEARSNVVARAFRVIADRVEHREQIPDEAETLFAA